MPRTFAPDSLTPEDALERLREGNRRFVRGDGNAVRRWQPHLIDGQQPFAVILGCADSRAPAEYVFDQGLGDLFVIRVAGNIVAPSLTGSVEFAASQFGTRLVVVMGHTQCGAVRATVRSLGPIGIGLTVSLFGSIAWLLAQWQVVDLSLPDELSVVSLAISASVLGVGMSWSAIRYRISGQYDSEDVGATPLL